MNSDSDRMPTADQAAARAEALRFAEQVAILNGISVEAALAAMDGVVEAGRRLGLGPTPEQKEAEKQASMSRADRRREQHARKVERRAAARRTRR